MVDKETGLWPRFQRVRRAVSEAMAGGKGKVNIYRWGGEDAGILDLAGQRLGEFGGVSVELKIKGTDSGWQQELEVDPSGDLHFTKRRGGSMNVEGLFRSVAIRVQYATGNPVFLKFQFAPPSVVT